MRAREFIKEEKGLRGKGRGAPEDNFAAAHPGIIAPHGRGDFYIGRYYDFYRVAQLTGLDPEELKKVDAISFFGNLPLYSAYSDEDRKKLMQVMKKIGLEPKDYINTGSSEVQDTHVKSPINAFKGYKK